MVFRISMPPARKARTLSVSRVVYCKSENTIGEREQISAFLGEYVVSTAIPC